MYRTIIIKYPVVDYKIVTSTAYLYLSRWKKTQHVRLFTSIFGLIHKYLELRFHRHGDEDRRYFLRVLNNQPISDQWAHFRILHRQRKRFIKPALYN